MAGPRLEFAYGGVPNACLTCARLNVSIRTQSVTPRNFRYVVLSGALVCSVVHPARLECGHHNVIHAAPSGCRSPSELNHVFTLSECQQDASQSIPTGTTITQNVGLGVAATDTDIQPTMRCGIVCQ